MKLRITTPGTTFEYSPPPGKALLSIGGRPDDDIPVVDDPQISGPHVKLEHTLDRWTFSDQFSAKGTKHNGEIRGDGELKVGDVLTLADTKVEVLELDAAAMPPPKPATERAPTPARRTPDALTDDLEFKEGSPPGAGSISPELMKKLGSLEPERIDLTLKLSMALYDAAKRLDMPTYAEDDRQQRYIRNIVVAAGIKAPLARIRHIWLPLARIEKAPVYTLQADIEENPQGNKAGDASDLKGMAAEVYRLVATAIKDDLSFDAGSDSLAADRLADEATDCADAFEKGERFELRLPYITANASGPKHFASVVVKSDGAAVLGERLPPPDRPAGQGPPEEDPLAEAFIQRFRDKFGDEPSAEMKAKAREMAAGVNAKPGGEHMAHDMIEALHGGPPGVPKELRQAVIWAGIQPEQNKLFVMVASYLKENYGLDFSDNFLASSELGQGVRIASEKLKEPGVAEADISLFQPVTDDAAPVSFELTVSDGKVIRDTSRSMGMEIDEQESPEPEQKKGCLVLFALLGLLFVLFQLL